MSASIAPNCYPNEFQFPFTACSPLIWEGLYCATSVMHSEFFNFHKTIGTAYSKQRQTSKSSRWKYTVEYTKRVQTFHQAESLPHVGEKGECFCKEYNIICSIYFKSNYYVFWC